MNNTLENPVDFTELRSILNSKIRLHILFSLFNEGKTLGELADSSDKAPSTYVNNLKFLELSFKIFRKQKKYYLTSLGKLLALKLFAFINNWNVINDNFDFWQKHSLDSIPKDNLNKLYSLEDCEYVYSTVSNMKKPLISFMDLLILSTNSKIVLPIFSEKHCDIIFNTLTNDKNKKMELCINSKVFDKIKAYYTDELINFKNNGQLKLNVLNKDINLFLVVTEYLMSLNLFLIEGFYDDSVILLNDTPISIEWAKNLFNYLKNQSDAPNIYSNSDSPSLIAKIPKIEVVL